MVLAAMTACARAAICGSGGIARSLRRRAAWQNTRENLRRSSSVMSFARSFMISILRVPCRNRNSWISVKSAGIPASDGTSLVSDMPSRRDRRGRWRASRHRSCRARAWRTRSGKKRCGEKGPHGLVVDRVMRKVRAAAAAPTVVEVITSRRRFSGCRRSRARPRRCKSSEISIEPVLEEQRRRPGGRCSCCSRGSP